MLKFLFLHSFLLSYEIKHYGTILICVLGYVYTGPVRNGSGPVFGPDRPSVYTGPFWNRSGTDPKLDLQNSRSSFGSVPDRFQNGPV